MRSGRNEVRAKIIKTIVYNPNIISMVIDDNPRLSSIIQNL